MGCSSSKKLDEEAAVRTCHDRRGFVKKAVTQRSLLASSHVAYEQSLRRVSLALFYFFAEDEHLYFMQEAASLVHRPASPDKVVHVINCLRPGGAPVHPLEQWEPDAAETAAIVDGFFGLDHRFFQPASVGSASDAPVSPQLLPRWDHFWDPFSSLTDHHHRCGNYGVQEVKVDQDDDEQIPELEEESGDDDDGETEEAEEKVERVKAPAPEVVMQPREEVGEKEKADHASHELRVMANADIEQHGTPGFTVYVHRPPTSLAEAMKDIHGHFVKIVETASEVSVLLEVVPYQRKFQPPAPREDGEEQDAVVEIPPEPFELFKSQKESLDRLYEWEKRLYEEVRAGEKVRLAYEKKVALLRSQDANGAEPFAIEKTRAAIRDLRTKLDISITSVEAVSRRIAAVRDDELLPQLTQLVRGLARMWRVITEAHRAMKRTADEASAMLSSSAAAAAASRPDTGVDGGFRGPPPPPGPTRAASAAGALASELRSWRAALEAWAESQRAYAAALWGWARSCVKDGEDMPRLIVGWARAVESVDVEAATKAVDAVAAEAAGIASAAKRQRGGEEWFNEEEAKKKVCVGLAAALGAITEAGGMAVVGYDELVLEMDAMEQERGVAGRDESSMQY